MQPLPTGYYNEAFASGMIGSPRTLLLTPSTAEVLAQGGYTKKTLIEDLVETARKPTYEWTFSKVYGSYGRIFSSFDKEVEKDRNDPRAAKGKLPPWKSRLASSIPQPTNWPNWRLCAGNSARSRRSTPMNTRM
jgi:hypothetical protein